MSTLGPFQCIAGDSIPITAYILTLPDTQQATGEQKSDGSSSSSSESQTYVALLRATDDASDTQEATLYQIVIPTDQGNANDRQLFQLSRLSQIECAIAKSDVSSDKQPSPRKNVYLSVTDLDVSTLTEIKGFGIKHGSQITVLPSPSENIVVFGSRLEADIFQRALEHHSESMDSSSSTSDTSEDTKPKANPKGRKRSAGSVVVSLRRTSSTDSEPLAYEVIGMKLARPVKKCKGPITVTPTEPICNFYFLMPEDFAQVSEYYALLFSQVKRGAMTISEAANGNRKNANTSEGYLGIRCRHCGGKPKGSLFPSCAKNLQATPPTLHTHLMKCTSCPEITKRSLKVTKAKHKSDMLTIKNGTLTLFYSKLWSRIQDPDFGGEAHTQTIRDRLCEIERACSPSPSGMLKIQNEPKASVRADESSGEDEMIPHIVSCDELENDPLIAYTLPAAQISEPTESDWELTWDLLRRPQTPNSRINLQNPPETITVYPNPIVIHRAPIPVRVSDSGELYHNGEFIISDHYSFSLEPEIPTPKPQPKETTPKKPGADPEEGGKTRTFTRADEVNLIRGIMTHGKQWKKIWDECVSLQHIFPSALKDRARSKRFQGILSKAEANPSLLDDPQALCDSELSYTDYDTCSQGSVSPHSSLAQETEEKGKTRLSTSPQQLTIARFVPGLPIEALVDCSPFRGRNKSPLLAALQKKK